MMLDTPCSDLHFHYIRSQWECFGHLLWSIILCKSDALICIECSSDRCSQPCYVSRFLFSHMSTGTVLTMDPGSKQQMSIWWSIICNPLQRYHLWLQCLIRIPCHLASPGLTGCMKFNNIKKANQASVPKICGRSESRKFDSVTKHYQDHASEHRQSTYTTTSNREEPETLGWLGQLCNTSFKNGHMSRTDFIHPNLLAEISVVNHGLQSKESMCPASWWQNNVPGKR